jgi:hypothetical protein
MTDPVSSCSRFDVYKTPALAPAFFIVPPSITQYVIQVTPASPTQHRTGTVLRLIFGDWRTPGETSK